MARSAEKSMTTLARYLRAQNEEDGKREKQRRPFLATDCDDLRQAEKWRNQIISEIARKVAQIQNAGLGEFRIRDLNDEINKLLREKGYWEIRIRDLGGQDYSSGGPKLFGLDGQEVPGNRGYKYFGAAKELPGVRELFEQEPVAPPRRTRGDLMKHIDIDYYGYRDDDDGVLIPLERKVEREARKQMIKDFKVKKAEEEGEKGDQMEKEGDKNEEEGEKFEQMEEGEDEEDDNDVVELEPGVFDSEHSERSEVLRYMAHVPNIPTQQQMEEAMVERKKRELLQTYLGSDQEDL